MDNSKKFPYRLKELRVKHKLSQQQLGDKFNISKTGISYWESGRSEPSIAMIKELADFFAVSVDWLLGNSDILPVIDNEHKTTQTNGNGDGNSNTTNHITNNYSNCTESQMERVVKTNSNTTPKNNNTIFKIIDRMKEMNEEQLEQLLDYAYFVTSITRK